MSWTILGVVKKASAVQESNMFICPICGYDQLKEKPEEQAYNICSCCGTEFGYSDCSPDGTLELRWRLLQHQWIENGCGWHSKVVLKPENWNPIIQLKNITKVTYVYN